MVGKRWASGVNRPGTDCHLCPDDRTRGTRVRAWGRSRLLPRDTLMQREAIQVVKHRLAEIMAYEQYIRDPHRVEELHATRRPAKTLRYSLETYSKLFRSRLKWQVDLLKDLQTRLSDIHDCDVWIDFLPRFIEEEWERHERFFGHRRGFSRMEEGIDFLLRVRQHQRRDLYQQFLAAWEVHAREGRWGQLGKSLEQESAERPATVASRDGIAGRIGDRSSRA